MADRPGDRTRRRKQTHPAATSRRHGCLGGPGGPGVAGNRAGPRAPSRSGMNTSTCSSAPVRISRTTGSGPRTATWTRSGATPIPSSPASLLPVLDNLQRALATSWKQADKEPLIQGVDLVRSQMLQLFGRFGISPINALGQPFDPHVHEAVQQLPRDDVSPGTVVEVLYSGYLLHERVLRPARVGVAAPPTRGPASS